MKIFSLKFKFYSLKNSNKTLEKVFFTYYTHVTDLDSQYYIIVNGEKIEPL